MNIMGFIATIGMSSVYTGLAKVFTDAKFISVNDKEFQKLGSSAIFGFVPVPFVIMLALMILYGFMLRYTRFGRRSYMCGGNPQAARLSGMSPNRTTTVLYINCGALSAFAGSVLASRMHSATATAAQSVAIDAITASVLGGISFMGGSGGIAGCFVGLMLLSAFNNGLNVVQLQSYWQLVAQGALLIIALCVEFFGERARLKALKRREP
jgi:ribose/xylose/arabinose/galactoside ABC-type transport system permease subunit